MRCSADRPSLRRTFGGVQFGVVIASRAQSGRGNPPRARSGPGTCREGASSFSLSRNDKSAHAWTFHHLDGSDIITTVHHRCPRCVQPPLVPFCDLCSQRVVHRWFWHWLSSPPARRGIMRSTRKERPVAARAARSICMPTAFPCRWAQSLRCRLRVHVALRKSKSPRKFS